MIPLRGVSDEAIAESDEECTTKSLFEVSVSNRFA